MDIRKISRRRSLPSDYTELGHFTFLICRGWQKNVKGFITLAHSYCSTIFSIKPFVWWRSRCRRRRCLFKFSIFQIRKPQKQRMLSRGLAVRRWLFPFLQIVLPFETVKSVLGLGRNCTLWRGGLGWPEPCCENSHHQIHSHEINLKW